MQHEPWNDFDGFPDFDNFSDFVIGPDFTERLMQRIAAEPTPTLPLWRRLDAWESRLSERPALRIALRITALLAGGLNLAGLYIFLIGA